MHINRRALLGSAAAGTALALFGRALPASADVPPTHGFLLVEGRFIPVDVAGAAVTLASSVNDRGKIVGIHGDGVEEAHGFIRDKLGTTSFDVPGALTTFPQDINNQHQIVGTYVTPAITIHGFLRKAGEYLTIDMPGSIWNSINGINDHGDMVGSWVDAAGVQHGFIRRAGTVTSYDFPSPGTTSTALTKINNSGVIIGAYHEDAGALGFMIKDGVVAPIEVPDGSSVVPNGLNDDGDIVGYYRDPARVVHGFVSRDGRVTKVDAPGGTATMLFDINNSGHISGAYETGGLGARPVGIHPRIPS